MNTLFIGQQHIKLEQVDSTNRYAQDLAKNGLLHEGAIISAYEQFSGKGQRGSNWQSMAGKNLTLSLYLKPTLLKISEQFLLSQCIALAVFDCLNFYCKKGVFIKWPNDILINDKKAAGILIESTLKNDRIDFSIIGIGLNINQSEFENLPQATSLKLQTGKDLIIDEVLNNLCRQIEKRYLQLKKDSTAIQKNYLENLYRYKSFANYHYKGNKVIAQIIDIDNSGKLILEKENGELLICDLKEVAFVS
jgi:BirA family biotin operon repressor/biotin-[acetyl-CoA-carboxylase] ligase